MREVWLALYGTATGIFTYFPRWVIYKREFEKWREVENEVEAKKIIRQHYSIEALFLMGLDDLTQMQRNRLYALPVEAIRNFRESI